MRPVAIELHVVAGPVDLIALRGACSGGSELELSDPVVVELEPAIHGADSVVLVAQLAIGQQDAERRLPGYVTPQA